MADDPHSRGGPPTYRQPGATEPSHAERTRTLLAGSTDGTLSTIAVSLRQPAENPTGSEAGVSGGATRNGDPAGHPFGSIVTFAVADDGAPLILMSSMAEHARNLDADQRASLLVSASGEGAGRLAAARATLVGTVQPVPEAQQEAATETYLAAHPGAFWARFPDFAVRRLDVTAIRYVRGFGEMSWVDVAAFPTAQPDPVAPAEAGIVEHMNADHADSMREMVQAFLDVQGTAGEVSMLSCDRYGFEVQIAVDGDPAGNEVAFGRIGFPETLSEAGQARTAMVELVTQARST